MTAIRFETTDCTRCGGTGRMPYSVYAGVCFKCNGNARMYTPRGRRAYNAFTKYRDSLQPRKAFKDVRAGDRFSFGGGWYTATADAVPSRGRSQVNGEWVDNWNVATKRTDISMVPTREVVIWTADAQRQAIQKFATRAGVEIVDPAPLPT